ncbi:MAG: hypothetical protein ABW080_17500 [Candidatus Thiodiazotropha sp.]
MMTAWLKAVLVTCMEVLVVSLLLSNASAQDSEPSVEPAAVDVWEGELPAYTRIAVSPGKECDWVVKDRNRVAREMNDLVGRASGLKRDSVDFATTLGDWNELRQELLVANGRLRYCLGDRKSGGDSDSAIDQYTWSLNYVLYSESPPQVCPECQDLVNKYYELRNKYYETRIPVNEIADELVSIDKQIKGLPKEEARSKEQREKYNQLKKRSEELESEKKKIYKKSFVIWDKIIALKTQLYLCLFEHCPGFTGMPAATLDQHIENQTNDDDWMAFELPWFFFVSTSCDDARCKRMAKEINEWVLKARKVINNSLEDALKEVERNEASWIKNRDQLSEEQLQKARVELVFPLAERLRKQREQDFYTELKNRRAELKACELKYCGASSDYLAMSTMAHPVDGVDISGEQPMMENASTGWRVDVGLELGQLGFGNLKENVEQGGSDAIASGITANVRTEADDSSNMTGIDIGVSRELSGGQIRFGMLYAEADTMEGSIQGDFTIAPASFLITGESDTSLLGLEVSWTQPLSREFGLKGNFGIGYLSMDIDDTSTTYQIDATGGRTLVSRVKESDSDESAYWSAGLTYDFPGIKAKAHGINMQLGAGYRRTFGGIGPNDEHLDSAYVRFGVQLIR